MVCLLAAVGGCRKKAAPQYYEAQGRFDVVTARLGDEAYEGEEMASIEALLRSVPESAKEAPKAQALLVTIGTEKARVFAEAEARARPINTATAPAVFPAGSSPSTAVVAIAPTAPQDAGFVPRLGMPFDAFLTAYGSCMDQADDVLMPGAQKPARAVSVRKTGPCWATFGGNAKLVKLFVFVDDKLAGEASRTEPDSDKPYAGMSAAAFQREFGVCMSAGPDITLPGATRPSQAFTVRKEKACTDKFGGAGDGITKAYVFNDGKLAGETTRQTTMPAAPGPNGATPILNPGSSLPSGVNSALPPPDPSTAVTPDSNQR